MGWDIELAAVRTDELDWAVPDVFVPTSTTVGFENATSGRRAPRLCATKVGDWVIVIDVACRLLGSPDYLTEASASTDLHLVRLADEPIALHYRDGRPVLEARGIDACLELAPRDDEDGESCAMDLLFDGTGVSFGGEELGRARFTVFDL